MPVTIRLAYGREGLDVALPDGARVLAPHAVPALADPAAAVRAALRAPTASPPLAELVHAGQRVAIVTSDLTRPVPNRLLLEALLEADVRIVTGFIEPHLFAGYSGGGKGVMPGIAGREAIMSNHSAAMVGDPRATFGVTAGNPIFEEMRRFALVTEPTFLVNVTMDAEQRVTGVFAGDLVAAHDAGIEACRRQALVAVDAPFDVVVTTNGGYPADLNLYQAVKGIAVAARAVRPGGHVILAAECVEGVGHGGFGELLAAHGGHLELLETLRGAQWETVEDQWQAQLQALAQERGTVWLHSSLDEAATRATQLRYCADVGATVAALASEIEAREGRAATVAVLPYGQQAVPVVREGVGA